MADYQNIVLISTIADDVISFSKLSAALREIYKQGKYSMPLQRLKLNRLPFPEAAMTPRETYYSQKKYVKLNKACGLISADILTPYPPGIPVIYPGEIISADIIEYILGIMGWGGKVNGVTNDCSVQVVD
jgi:arginine decarboxylase